MGGTQLLSVAVMPSGAVPLIHNRRAAGSYPQQLR